MRFGVLGPVTVWTSAGEAAPVPGVKVRALLADLLVQAGEAVPAGRLIDDLWGERPPADPAGALQAKVSQLRRALAAAGPGGRELVGHRPPGYLLRVTGEQVDALQFQALLGRAMAAADPAARARMLTQALSLWRGRAFADFGDELFTQAMITRLEEDRLGALEARAEARLELGEHAQLAGELSDLVSRHPLRERLRAAQMRVLYLAGRQNDALASYRELRERLSGELGLDPGPQLAALQQAILRQDPALAVPVPASTGLAAARTAPADAAPAGTVPAGAVPAAAAAPPRTNLPAAVEELIGRRGAVARVRAQVGSSRLVTLTGPGGVGKTRLALAVAASLAGDYPDGAWLAELAMAGRTGKDGQDGRGGEGGEGGEGGSAGQGAEGGVAGEDSLAGQVAAAIGIRDDAPAGSLADWLAAALRPRQMLLVLDNCEHLIEPAAALAGRLLRAAPGLRILATSQEPLAIAGEQLSEVPPLGLPAADAADEPAQLAQAGAVALFVARASAAAAGFALTAANASAVRAICQRLDGIPLALELAAARVRALGVEELAARLDDRFGLLTAGKRGGPARQQTLQAVIEWSWSLATGPEQMVLRRLAVFADGCPLAAAEQVCAGQGVDRADVAVLLARLVDRSLVAVSASAGQPRYRLLESVAAYGTQRLRERGELDRVRDLHCQFWTGFAEQARPRLRGADQRLWLDRLDADAANFRAALDTAITGRAAGLALRLVNALTWYWFLRGRLTEARRALTAALAVPDGPSDGTAPAGGRAFAAAWQTGITLLAGGGDPAQSAAVALAGYRGAGDGPGQAEARWLLGFATSDFGDPSASAELIDQALSEFGRLGDRWGIAAALSTRAKLAAIRGDLAAVSASAEQSLALFRELGDRWGQLQATEWLGARCEDTGDFEQGRRLHADGLRLAQELGLWPQAADRLCWLGRIAMLTGDHAGARELLDRAIELAAGQSYQPGKNFAEISMGALERREGRLDSAEARLREALRWYREMGYPADTGSAMVLAELGFAAEQRADPRAAEDLHAGGLETARRLGDPRAIATALEGLAGARVIAGAAEQAAMLLGTATAARQSAGVPRSPAEQADVDRISAATRAALGEQRFAAQFDRGTLMPPEQASRQLAER
ncbi:MAG TPA: BTAD domain-containing putative transcriptional regulator [Streptosporangiaceae bacterium]|jgi:predicted ATPase/DNA-binding SARP family transcriptional activator